MLRAIMTETYTPAEACEIVTAATDFHLDARTLRQWRNRGLFTGGPGMWSHSFAQREAESGWTHYSRSDVFALGVMAEVIRAGYTARTAANIARGARDYAPADGGHPESRDEVMLIPGVFSGVDDDGAFSLPRVVCSHAEISEALITIRKRLNTRVVIYIDLEDMRARFSKAVAQV